MAKKKQDRRRKGAIASDDAPSMIERLAILGDSGLALIGSFSLLVFAVFVSFLLDEDTHQVPRDLDNSSPDLLYQKLGPVPKIDPPHVYSIEEDSMDVIQQAYSKDGVVAVRGLIPTTLLDRLNDESRIYLEKEAPKTKSSKRGMQFHTMKNGAAFLDPPNTTWSLELGNVTAFLEVAVLSSVPKLASELMLPEMKRGESVRMMRDIFLTRSSDQDFACGFHVDDVGFWPATADSPGINAWIALDDMPSSTGGGFALAVGSHTAPWRQEAQYVTGATTFFPEEGYKSAADMFENRTGSGTCNIHTSAPHLHRRMEDTTRVYNLQKGDVIFHQRFLFHRTVPFESNYAAKMLKDENLLYGRYSVRYSPGSAIVPPGYGTELSVLWDENNGNLPADQVCGGGDGWYPRVWPAYDPKEIQGLSNLVKTKMSVAEERRLLRLKEMQPFLKKMARQKKMDKPNP